MGSLFKPKVPDNPPAPPAPELIDVRDEISGTETVYVTGPDGKKTAVMRKLPLTPAQQEAENKLTQIMNDNLARIEVLSGPDYADAIPGLKDTLKAFSDYNTGIVNKGYAKVNAQAQRDLGRRGMSDSTSAVQTQVGLGRAQAQDLTTIGQQAELMKNDIRDSEIARSQNLFGIASQRGDLNFANAVGSLGRMQNTQGMMLEATTGYNNMLYQSAIDQQALRASASAANKNAWAAITGAAIGSAAGAATGKPKTGTG